MIPFESVPPPQRFDLGQVLSERATAGIQLLRQCGMKQLQVRFSDEPPPVVWVAVGLWPSGRNVGAAFTPDDAVLQLCRRAVDGGHCQHCHRSAVFLVDVEQVTPMPGLCAYQWDPELRVFRRSCEGSDR